MKRPGAVLLLAALLAVNAHASGWAAGAVARAATALGGRDRIEAVRNITLIGYGQYAYVYG
ncbi:MAG: hypothetical protein WB440_21030, partial [Steroidobacteraceae bacterium]